MAVYKVIQDVEAEDKLVGPLTFRQFVYAGVAAVLAYLCYLLITHHAGFLAIPFLPLVIVSGFFAWPWGRDQPTEIWALAKIRFFFKPRRRIWDQSGAKNLVTITVPKKVAVNYTDGLSQTEVKSRLKALADTLDSRGWAMRGTNNSPATAPTEENSDRLVSVASLPEPVRDETAKSSDDIMDPKSNPIAKQFDDMIVASTEAHRQRIIDNLERPAPPKPAPVPASTSNPVPPAPPPQWFLGQPMQPSVSTPQTAVTFNAQVVSPGTPVTSLPLAPAEPTPYEEQFIKQVKWEDKQPDGSTTHLHTINPLPLKQQTQSITTPQSQPPPPPPRPSAQTVTQASSTGILDLASNNDLNVATIAREAKKRRPQEEVVILLH